MSYTRAVLTVHVGVLAWPFTHQRRGCRSGGRPTAPERGRLAAQGPHFGGASRRLGTAAGSQGRCAPPGLRGQWPSHAALLGPRLTAGSESFRPSRAPWPRTNRTHLLWSVFTTIPQWHVYLTASVLPSSPFTLQATAPSRSHCSLANRLTPHFLCIYPSWGVVEWLMRTRSRQDNQHAPDPPHPSIPLLTFALLLVLLHLNPSLPPLLLPCLLLPHAPSLLQFI